GDPSATRLIRPDLRAADDSRVFFDVRSDACREGFGREAERLTAVGGEALAHVRLGEHLADGGVQALDHGAGRSARSKYSIPGGEFIARQARLRNGRQLGGSRTACRTR